MSAFVTPLQLRDAIVRDFRAGLPGLSDCGTHQGQFDLAALKRYGAGAPAARICILGLGAPLVKPSGQLAVPVDIACVIVTRDLPGLPRDASANALAIAASLLIANNRWGFLRGGDGSSPPVAIPEQIRAHNVYAEAIDKEGLAVWQVLWQQSILLGEEVGGVIGTLSAMWINGAPFDGGSHLVPSPAVPRALPLEGV